MQTWTQYATAHVEVKLMHPDVIPPQYTTHGAAGMDIRAYTKEKFELNPGGVALVPTGLCFNMKNLDIAGVVMPRSGLGYKHGIIMANTIGLIDSDYQGEVQIPLWNRSDKLCLISPQDRIAQIVFIPVQLVDLKVVDDFEPTERGTKGFGSTGLQ